MNVKPLRNDLKEYLTKRGLLKKFDKQITLFSNNPSHPSLHTEILEPRQLKNYSFRLNLKYRVIFGIWDNGDVEIVDINDHYQ